jgi:hypothetical protein
MERESLTPGRLYARLAAEYRRVRPSHCGNCRMPMVVLTHRTHPDGPNWALEDAPLCERCAPLIAAIVREAAASFDIRDPTAVPFLPSLAGNHHPLGAHRH